MLNLTELTLHPTGYFLCKSILIVKLYNALDIKIAAANQLQLFIVESDAWQVKLDSTQWRNRREIRR